MKRTMYIISGYAMGILFSGSFFFSLYFLFQFNMILGFSVVALMIGVAVFLLADPENYEEIVESDSMQKLEEMKTRNYQYDY